MRSWGYLWRTASSPDLLTQHGPMLNDDERQRVEASAKNLL